MKKYVAELLGTSILTLVVGTSLVGSFPVATPILAGLTLALFVYTIGSISGCHINPGVTLGFLAVEKISIQEASKYIAAQFLGSFIAVVIMQFFDILPQVNSSLSVATGFAEIVGTALLTFGIASIAFSKNKELISGIVIGGSLLLGISTAVLLGSNGVLNPAVAVGIGSINLYYLLCPIIGGALGMKLYKYLAD